MAAKDSDESSSVGAFGGNRLRAHSLGELEQMLHDLEHALEVMEESIFAFQRADWQKGCDSPYRHAAESNQSNSITRSC
jgi:hypothetical protein